MKVLIVNGDRQYERMFASRGWEVSNIDPASKSRDIINLINQADLVQFTGGADVTPEIYGQENTRSGNNPARDLFEAGIFAIALRVGKPMAGICRGGQFLNVMCGGKMVQHVEGHATGQTHMLRTWDGRDIPVSSTHHQMMVPKFDSEECDLIGWANIVGEADEEIIIYQDHKVLCFQPHPEFSNVSTCRDLYFELIEKTFGLVRND